MMPHQIGDLSAWPYATIAFTKKKNTAAQQRATRSLHAMGACKRCKRMQLAHLHGRHATRRSPTQPPPLSCPPSPWDMRDFVHYQCHLSKVAVPRLMCVAALTSLFPVTFSVALCLTPAPAHA